MDVGMALVLGHVLISGVVEVLKVQFFVGVVQEVVFEFVRLVGLQQELIEDVEVLLILRPGDYSRFLEQIVIDLGVPYSIFLVHKQTQVFAEPAGIVVSDGPRVSEGLQDGIRQDDRFLYLRVVFRLVFSFEEMRDEMKALLVGLGLTCT